jgi:hypothetical protein
LRQAGIDHSKLCCRACPGIEPGASGSIGPKFSGKKRVSPHLLHFVRETLYVAGLDEIASDAIVYEGDQSTDRGGHNWSSTRRCFEGDQSE